MDLFIMNRYLGDENDDKGSRQDHLANLLAKIEERKRNQTKETQLKVTNNEDTTTNDQETVYSEPVEEPKKSRKRKKEKVSDESVEEPVSIHENGELTKKQKKAKKRKVVVKENLEEDTNESNGKVDLLLQENAHEEKDVQQPKGFTFLGGEQFQKKEKVKRVLPYWLAHPSVLSGSLQDSSVSVHDILELDKDLVKRLESNNITHFFPVQRQVIPWFLAEQSKPFPYRPCDVCVSAPTGSGKTLAFVLPIVQCLKPRVVRHVRALIVLPVQELAAQVYQVFEEYCKDTDLKVILLSRKKPFKQEQQDLIKTSAVIGDYSAVDIVVTTSGRLIDHIVGTKGFSLSYLKFLIVDEADRIMNETQVDWLYHVEKHINKNNTEASIQKFLTVSSLKTNSPPPQKLLFSATLSQDPEKLDQLGLFQPKLFTNIVGEAMQVDGDKQCEEYRGDFIGKYTTPAELSEKYYVVNPELKPLMLYHLITSEKWDRVLCFTNSQKNTHRLALLLQHLGGGELKVGELSSASKSNIRARTLRRFAEGHLNILVSSDALARGIDVPDINYVVLYNMPPYVKTYIHRIGRTARAGKAGNAVTLLAKTEIPKFKSILKSAGKNNVKKHSVDESLLEYLEEKFTSSLEALRLDLKKEDVENRNLRHNIKGYKRKIKKQENGSAKKLKKHKKQS